MNIIDTSVRDKKPPILLKLYKVMSVENVP